MINVCHGSHKKPTKKQRDGIIVCDEWQGESGFVAFKTWALKNGFSPDLVLDRIDTTGNYCSENCRYITQKENNRNKINTIYVELNGVRKPLSAICEETGIPYNKAYYWVKKGIPISSLL